MVPSDLMTSKLDRVM